MSSSRWWFAESRFVHVWHVLQIYYQEMKTKPMCSVLELDEGMKWKWSLTFFWKMIPIKNIIVISIIWLAWAITASFYSTHANVSHVPTPPPPPPTQESWDGWWGGPKHFRSNNARRMFKLTQMLTFEHIHENYLYWSYLEISWYILAEEERQ